MDLSIRFAREPRIVGDHSDPRSLAVQFTQQLHDCLAVLGIQVLGGLISEEYGRLALTHNSSNQWRLR